MRLIIFSVMVLLWILKVSDMENLKSVINILKNIENNSSTKKKLEILNENKDNTLLKDIIDYTYNKL